MKWLKDVFKLLRFIDKQSLDYEKRVGLKYNSLGNDNLWMNLSLIVQRYHDKYPKISQARANKIAIYAAAYNLLDTRTQKGTMKPDEDSFDVSISLDGHRFIDLDFGFIPTRFIIAWFKEDGKVVMLAFGAIISLLGAILAVLIRLLLLI